jgi:hypothetical protein
MRRIFCWSTGHLVKQTGRRTMKKIAWIFVVVVVSWDVAYLDKTKACTQTIEVDPYTGFSWPRKDCFSQSRRKHMTRRFNSIYEAQVFVNGMDGNQYSRGFTEIHPPGLVVIFRDSKNSSLGNLSVKINGKEIAL